MKLIKYIIPLTLWITFTLIGCSNENEALEPIEKEGLVTFSIPGMAKKGITYADPVASNEENELATLDVYMFHNEANTEGKLERIFRFGDNNTPFGGTSQAPTATLDLTGQEGSKKFYFVANAEGKIAESNSINVGETTENEFVDFLTVKQVELLTTPLLMSGVVVIDLSQPITQDMTKVQLKRRVARFDVSNIETDTHFTIQKIMVSEVSQQAFLFGTSTATSNLASGKLPVIDFAAIQGANTGDIPGVFYIYPSTLGAGKGNIAFEGVFNGETRIYELELTANVDIEANKRYTLIATTITPEEVTFELAITEWQKDARDEYEAESGNNKIEFPEEDKITFSNMLKTGENVFDVTYATSESKLIVPIKTYNKSQAQISITYSIGDKNVTDIIVNEPEPILTYSAGYMLEYEFTIPARSSRTDEVQADILIINNDDPEQRMAITIKGGQAIYYPGTTLYPIMIGNVVWAPVNTGSKTLDDPGFLHQWGRNYGAKYTTTPTDIHTVTGPLSKSVADGVPYTFIKGPNSMPYDWLAPQDSTLWSGNNAKGPCPDGWKTPERKELLQLYNVCSDLVRENRMVLENKIFKIQGNTPSEQLCIPINGYRAYNSGHFSTAHVYWWGNDMDPNPIYKYRATQFHINQDLKSVGLSSNYRGHGFSVRCVKNPDISN